MTVSESPKAPTADLVSRTRKRRPVGAVNPPPRRRATRHDAAAATERFTASQEPSLARPANRTGPRRHRRGTAMMETVFVTPLLLLVAALLIFFGRSAMRMQRTAMLDRYEVWRSVEESPGPRSDNNGSSTLNSAFLNGVAQSVENLGPASLPADRGATALTSSVRDHPNFQPLTPDLAAQFVGSADGRRSASFRANFPRIAPALLALDRPFQHTHARIGNNWQAFNGWAWNQGNPERNIAPYWQPTWPGTSILPSARTTFFQDQSQILESAAQEHDGQLTETVTRTYLSEPGYVGPEVRF